MVLVLEEGVSSGASCHEIFPRNKWLYTWLARLGRPAHGVGALRRS